MESTERGLTTRDTVLLIADAIGGTVPGRTVMQKLAYFSGIALGSTLGHRAYYYGPYSSKVEDALSVASIAGELHETADRMSDWSGGPGHRQIHVHPHRGRQATRRSVEGTISGAVAKHR